ncbi:GPO family capsid scaffolding protein [Pasteurella multocida]
MKTELFTDFICVATAGATIDGRQISAQDLKDMAESYDPDLYTALIWIEHYRYFGNCGRVVELKTEDDNGQTKLYARLAPNAQLLEMNQAKQKIFTSIEITPNFAQTGKAYLSGLAITDSPASTGTSALMFKRIGSNNVMIGETVELDLVFNEHKSKDADKQNLRSRFFNWLFCHGEVPEGTDIQPFFNTTANHGKTEPLEIENMDKQEFSQIIATAVSTAVAQAFSAQAQKVEQTEVQNHNTQQSTANEAKPVEQNEQGVSKQEFNDLKSKYEALETKFNQLSTPVTVMPSELGDVDNSNKFNLEKSGF